MLFLERIEGDTALCESETRETVSLSLSLLPPDAREGDVLIPDGEGYRVDREETDRRRKLASARFHALFHRPSPSKKEESR